jgi:hypothetical protein
MTRRKLLVQPTQRDTAKAPECPWIDPELVDYLDYLGSSELRDLLALEFGPEFERARGQVLGRQEIRDHLRAKMESQKPR